MKLISGRVIFAAAKLALIYCVLLCIEVAALFLLIGSRTVFTLRDLAGAATTLLVPFGISFLLLAVARRAGFVALWAILVGFWGALLVQSREFVPHALPVLFLLWSFLAMPLWIIGHAGIPGAASSGVRIGSHKMSWATTALLCWLLLLVGTRLFGPLGGPSYLLPLAPPSADIARWALYAPAPLLIAAFAVRHVWRGTAGNLDGSRSQGATTP